MKIEVQIGQAKMTRFVEACKFLRPSMTATVTEAEQLAYAASEIKAWMVGEIHSAEKHKAAKDAAAAINPIVID